MNTLIQDVRYGLRLLLKNKGFAVVAILALGLGVGANTAIFSLVNGVLLRPLPFGDAERIIYLEGKNPAAGITDSNVSFLDFMDWSRQADLFKNTAAYWTASSNLVSLGDGPMFNMLLRNRIEWPRRASVSIRVNRIACPGIR